LLSQQGLVVFVYDGVFYPGFYVYGTGGKGSDNFKSLPICINNAEGAAAPPFLIKQTGQVNGNRHSNDNELILSV
jgi:hypothetical protein